MSRGDPASFYFYEKNIFFSRNLLDKIEKVWYNIYVNKRGADNPETAG
nr:MAG TPA: hypothetical protein [Caudoviricetes sp.]